MEYKSYTERKIAWRIEYGRWKLIEYMLEDQTYSMKGAWSTIKIEDIKALKELYYVKLADFSSARLNSVLVYLRNKGLIEFKNINRIDGWYRFKVLSERDFIDVWDEKKKLIKAMKKAKIVK